MKLEVWVLQEMRNSQWFIKYITSNEDKAKEWKEKGYYRSISLYILDEEIKD